MGPDPELIAAFRRQLQESRDADEDAWARSRHCVAAAAVDKTLRQLVEAIAASSLPAPLQDALTSGLRGGHRPHAHQGELLKQVTGLPPTKAVRALCVLFGVTGQVKTQNSVLSAKEIERFVREHGNPFDLLLRAGTASVLDLGAGDLSFASELAGQYGARLHERGEELTLHSIDRLRPGSRLAGPLHADPRVLEQLTQGGPGSAYANLQFRFWSNQDMFELDRAKRLLPLYTIVTCYAPATPTFAYEPTRLASSIIHGHLQDTKGRFRRVRVEGEEALEVFHQGRSLLFPPWKFDVRTARAVGPGVQAWSTLRVGLHRLAGLLGNPLTTGSRSRRPTAGRGVHSGKSS
jgi:hypothetical protein